MSHRQEDKARLRAEREAAERAAAQSSARRKRLGIVLGAALVAAIAVVVALAVFAGGDDDTTTPADTRLPAQKIDNIAEAARAAGCKLQTSKVAGRGHTTKSVTYATNPPTSGDHDPTPAEDGIYGAGNPPDVEQSVHALEHGRVAFQYRKGTPANRINQLEVLTGEQVKGEGGYHTLLFENQTGMPAAVAATAWTQSLTCPTFDDKVFDALRAFRRTYVDKGPEFIP